MRRKLWWNVQVEAKMAGKVKESQDGRKCKSEPFKEIEVEIKVEHTGKDTGNGECGWKSGGGIVMGEADV